MQEKSSKTGPRRKYPDAIYALAYQLYIVEDKPASAVAAAINAKEITDRIDGTQVQSLARIGQKDAEALNGSN